jgi:hypothetical protein
MHTKIVENKGQLYAQSHGGYMPLDCFIRMNVPQKEEKKAGFSLFDKLGA